MLITIEIDQLVFSMGEIFLSSLYVTEFKAEFENFLRMIITQPLDNDKLDDWSTVLEQPQLSSYATRLNLLLHGHGHASLVNELEYQQDMYAALLVSLSRWHQTYKEPTATHLYPFRNTKERLLCAALYRISHNFQQAATLEERNRLNLEFKLALTKRNEAKLSLAQINLMGMDISGCDFSYCEMSEAILDQVTAKEANFNGTMLLSCKMQNAHFIACHFSQASLRGGDRKKRSCFSKTVFENCVFIQADFFKADLRGTKFIISNPNQLRDMNLQEAWLDRNLLLQFAPYTDKEGGLQLFSFKKISLQGEDLRKVNLSNLYLHSVYFGCAEVAGAVFENTDLKHANLKKVKGLEAKQLVGALNIKEAELPEKILNKLGSFKGQTTLSMFFLPRERSSPVENQDKTYTQIFHTKTATTSLLP